jgi:spore maturation protein CgeB
MHSGTNSRDIFLDIIDGYRDLGHNIVIFPLGPYWTHLEKASSEKEKSALTFFYAGMLAESVKENGINLCISMWGNGAAPFYMGSAGQDFYEYLGVPLLMHWLDAPQWAMNGSVVDSPTAMYNSPYKYHYTNNEAAAIEMDGIMGFKNIIVSPNAANPKRFRSYPEVKKEYDIMFSLGMEARFEPTDAMLEELDKDEPDSLKIRRSMLDSVKQSLLPVVEPLFEEKTEEFVTKLLDSQLSDRHKPILQRISEMSTQNESLLPAILKLLKNPRAFVDISSALRAMENWGRQFIFVWLSKYYKMAYFGQTDLSAWPVQNWTGLGFVDYDEQSKAYNSAYFGLNVMRWQDDHGLNLKPFEITLSGTALLQEYRVGIDEAFNDNEAVIFQTPAECRNKVDRLLSQPESLQAIAENGYKRSLSEHCWKHRAAKVMEVFE